MFQPYLELNKAPEGATHCVFPKSDCDPLFYRMFEGVLQIWGIAVHRWIVSKHDPEYIDTLHRLEE